MKDNLRVGLSNQEPSNGSMIGRPLKSILVSASLSLLLVSCGGGSSDSKDSKSETTKPVVEQTKPETKPTNPTTPSKPAPGETKPSVSGGNAGGNVSSKIAGRVIGDGYMSGVTVCLDINKNSQCDASSEPMTKSDANGKYELELKTTHRTPSENTNILAMLKSGTTLKECL